MRFLMGGFLLVAAKKALQDGHLASCGGGVIIYVDYLLALQSMDDEAALG